MGIIGFLDGGRAFSKGLFSGMKIFSGQPEWGKILHSHRTSQAGYRVPVQRREGIDDSFQIT
jgi:hypothetical protein